MKTKHPPRPPRRTSRRNESARRLILPAECLRSSAPRLHERLCALADAEEPVIIDVRALERIDTPSLQLLLAFVSARSAGQRAVQWRGPSRVLLEAARLTGMHALTAAAAVQ
jgi:ABC-type transporter Mla MlaB component